MKKIILATLVAVFALSAFGQKKDFKKIREAKIDFLKQKLALTEEEEKKFIPLYEKFMDESDALRKGCKDNVNLAEVDLTFMSDADCEKLINNTIEYKQKEVDLIKKYTVEFKKVLPVKKVAMIFKAEMEFKRHLLKKLHKNRKGKMGDRNNDPDEDEKE